MKKNEYNKKKLFTFSILTFLLFLWWLFFTVNKTKQINNNKSFFFNNWTNFISKTGKILFTKDLQNFINTETIDNKIKNQQYFEALQDIKWEKSIDYYNRGTIYLLWAYNEAMQNKNAQIKASQNLITKAYNNFSTAQKLQLNNILENTINKNKKITTQLQTLIEQKICFKNRQDLIHILNNINKLIATNKNKLIQSLDVLQKNKKRITSNWGIDCYQKSIEQTEHKINALLDLYPQIRSQKNNQNKQIINSIKNKENCDFFPNSDFRNNISQTKKELESLIIDTNSKTNTIINKDLTKLKLQCNYEKNDGEINKTNNNIKEIVEQINNISNNKKSNKPWDNNTNPNNSQNTLNENYLMDEKLKNQSLWIKNMLNIKAQKNYKYNNYIKSLFKIFYGNSNEFN